jgi:hypothetical protein
MKNTLKTICFFLLIMHISCKAQIVPLNNVDSPEGAYEKDLDNVLPFFEGTWKGTFNNKELTLQFTKYPNHLNTYSSEHYVYTDMLMAKFKVIDLSTNQVLYDDLSISAFEDYKITLLAYRLNEYSFIYWDTEANCYNKVEFALVKSNTNPNQIEYKDFIYGGYEYWDCTSYQNQLDIPMFLPKVDMTLIRQ